MKGQRQVRFPRRVNQFKRDRSKRLFVIASLLFLTFIVIVLGSLSVRLTHVAINAQDEAAIQPSKATILKNFQYLISNRSIVEHGLAPKNKKLMYPKFADAGKQRGAPPAQLPTFQRPDGGAFVHMGKTGGSALSILLRNGCHSWMPHPCRNVTNESMVSLLTASYYHVPDFAFLQQSHHDFYLVTTRDPFDRLVSAFVYEHIANRRARNDSLESWKKYDDAYVCFPTLEVFVSYLEGNSTDFHYPYRKNEVHPESCRDLARAAFHGRVRLFHHFYFSYQRIRNFLPNPDVIIVVTRQEHLWEDWVQINQLFGQETPVHVPKGKIHHTEARNVSTLRLPVTRDLSENGTATLCRAMQKEYEAYFWFLQHSKNLGSEEILEAVGKAKQRCGVHLKF